MNKEELQQIKDSIELQMIYERNSVYKKEYSSKLQEEINLYNEVVRLQVKEENLVKDLELLIEYGEGEDASRYDKIYAECAKNILKNIRGGTYESR